MVSFLFIILAITFNLVPANVDSFTLTMDEGQTLTFIKQEDDSWSGQVAGEADVRFKLEGAQMKIIDHQGHVSQLNPQDLITEPEAIDWQTVEELKVGPQTIRVERRQDGIDFNVTVEAQGQEMQKTIEVRWTPKSE